uniref:Phosphomethylpyrimidine synthase n=1 Tax=Candidatus Methanogaster sp. ANME-2c ERB4 TaxID=2759911 RepID=A0A7G9YDN5_9EURY|nr:phosphomethylpyrimidine synthase [Methanosarcinales archaeon ANME-2c ERB4]
MLSTSDDAMEGAMKIAAHAIDLVKPGVRERAHSMDLRMAIARKNLDWGAQFECTIKVARAALEKR